MKHEEIRGKKIILRRQREEDAPFFAYWFNQPQVMFQCGFEKTTDEEEEKRTINVSHKSEDSVWFTITDLDGNIIGETGLLRMFPAWHQTDLTIIIPDPGMQRKGYGTEALMRSVEYGFTELGLRRIYLGVYADNPRAIHVYEKCGFREYDRNDVDVFMEIVRNPGDSVSVPV